jgi:hypothetical protein
MADRGLQGWSADPFGVHQARYFSAGRPTKLVRDGDAESYDEPPSGPYPPRAAVIGAAAPAAPGGFAGEGREPYDGGTGFPPPRRGPASLAAMVSVLVIAAVIIGVLALTGPRSAPSGPDQAVAAAFVAQSASRTLAERTADATISGTVLASGQSVSLYGTGVVNFTANAMKLATNFDVSNQPMAEEEIEVNGNLYIATSVDGKLVRLSGERTWVQEPVPQADQGADLTGSDPFAALTVLERQGSTVRSLGTKSVDGVACSGFTVTPSVRMIAEGIKEEFGALGVSSGITDQELNQLSGAFSPLTMTIWIDQQHLVREMGINLQLNSSAGSSADALSADVVTDFSNYGAPVRIVAPPPADTISATSLLQLSAQ